MRLPDIKQCFELMERYEMLPNIKDHSILVARIAEQIVNDLLGSSTLELSARPDRNLVITGALLHDIAKSLCLKDGCDHAAQGAAICNRHGYPEIAHIIAEHVVLSSHDTERHLLGRFDAREIVYYADKRVMHDDIVDLDRRLEYIIATYGKNDARLHGLIRENFAKCLTLEEHLFAFLTFSPEDLHDRVMNNLNNTFIEVME